jgi:hypothetical protein
LTAYLYANHRLTLSSEKTRIASTVEFLAKSLHNPYAEIKTELFKSLRIFNPYTEEYEEVFGLADPDAALKAALVDALGKVIEFPHLDLGLARSIIRQARRSGIVELAPILLEQFEFFAPVVNDVMLYLTEVTDKDTAKHLLPLLVKVLDLPIIDNRLVRYWLEWYLCSEATFLNETQIKNFVSASQNIENQAKAAITTKNVAWVREKKAQVLSMADWARRAVFNAARVLPSDERTHWLKMCRANSPLLLDRLVASWVIDTA